MENFKLINKELTVLDLLRDINKVMNNNKELMIENKKLRIDKTEFMAAIKERDKNKHLLNGLTEFHAENMKEKNKRIKYLERQLNYIIYDQVKVLAIVLAEELDGFAYSEYQKEINPKRYQVNDREKKAYREYADLLLHKKGFIY